MKQFEQFEHQLRKALGHLRDHDLQPTDLLYEGMGCDKSEGSGALQARLLKALDDLGAVAEASEKSRSRLIHDSLYLRFVEGLTQEDTAERLHMSPRNLQRIQMEGIHILAMRLWLARQPNPDRFTTNHRISDWQAEVSREMAALILNDPDATANLTETLLGVVALCRLTLPGSFPPTFVLPPIPSSVAAACHPSILRQTLIGAVSLLAESLGSAPIAVHCGLQDGQITVRLSGSMEQSVKPLDDSQVKGILRSPDVTITLTQRGDSAFLTVSVPSAGQRTVLVVEDNPDTVHYYRRCTSGTSYRIVHVAHPANLFEAIEATAPDLVLLDVMMPTADGWQLLTNLHQRPATRDLPVIVCSVVKEESLALALGATLFSPKPVEPQALLSALNRAFDQQ